jgi:hypothetical protein
VADGAHVLVGKEARDRLGIGSGDEVAWTPLPPPGAKARGHG